MTCPQNDNGRLNAEPTGWWSWCLLDITAAYMESADSVHITTGNKGGP